MIAAACCLSGCDGGKSASDPINGRWTIEIEYQGPGMSGSMSMTGPVIETDGQLSGAGLRGTHNGDQVEFTISTPYSGPGGGQKSMVFICTGTYSGDSGNGAARVEIGGVYAADGTWTATME